jgi:DNA (cytosine-5)-methyltransferase 1
MLTHGEGLNNVSLAKQMSPSLLSVKDVSDRIGVSEQYVRTLIRRKRLTAERVGKSWVIPVESLCDFDEKLELPAEDRPRRKKKKPKLTALSFFSGAMGLDLGLREAGIEVLLASEIDPVTRQTIVANHEDIGLIGDITNYTADDIRNFAGLSASDELDLVVGGPPCQAFSTAGKREGFHDQRGNVFLTFIDRILELRPKFAVIENVRGLLSAPLKHRPHERRGFGYPPLTPHEDKGGALRHILNILSDAGYGVSFNLYNSANFGSPQKRERVILVCSRDGQKLPYLTPTHSEDGQFNLPKWRTVKEAFAGMKAVEHSFVPFPEKRLKYYRLLKAGQYWKHLPVHMQREALGASYYAGGGKTGFLRRVPWHEPSPTLVTHPAMPATDLAHPVENRPLSVQEYMRIQEFPDDYKIAGTIIDQYRQIGNAVPVSLGRAIGRLITDHLRGKKIKAYPDFPYSRYRFTDDRTWSKGSDAAEIPQMELAGLFG